MTRVGLVGVTIELVDSCHAFVTCSLVGVTKTTDWIYFHEIKQEILLKVAEIIENAGAQVAFPTSTIHLDRE